jgi:hypothetical protein
MGHFAAGGALAPCQHMGSSNRTDVFSFDVNGQLNVSWVVGQGAWFAPMRIGPTGIANPGTFVAASQQFGTGVAQTDVFFVDKNGQLNVFYSDLQGSWAGPVKIGPAGLALPGCYLAVSQQIGINQTDVFLVDKTGQLNVFYVVAGNPWGGPVKIGPAGHAPSGAFVAVSRQFGANAGGTAVNQTDVFLIDNNGQLNVFYVVQSGAWSGAIPLGAAGLATPGGYLAACQQFGLQQTDVFLVDKTGQLNVFWVDQSGPWQGPGKIGPAGYATAGANVAVSQQFGANSQGTPVGQTDVFLIDKNGQLSVFYVVNGGAWSSGGTIGPANIGRPGGYLAATQQFGIPQTDVVFNDVNGRLNVFWVYGSGAWGGPEVMADPVTPPTQGLGSNYNYLLDAGGAALTGVGVEIDVLQDITGTDGFGFQINAYSAAKDVDAAQQYLLTLNPSSSPPTIYCMVDNWYANGKQVINSGTVKVATLPSHTLPAGYKLTIKLNYDSNNNVTGATYAVYDNTGKNIGSQTQTLTSLKDQSGKQVTSAELAPIVAFQMDFVDWLNGNNTVLSSGAGTIVYTASQALTPTAYPPSYVDWSYITVETANSLYGYLPSTAASTIQQGFQANNSGAALVSTEHFERDNLQRKIVRHVTSPVPQPVAEAAGA